MTTNGATTMPRDRYDDDRDDRDDDRPRRRRYDDDEDDRPRRRRRDDDFDRRPAKTGGGKMVWIIVGVVGGVMVLAILGLVGLMLPAVQKVKEAQARMKASNDLKQLALGAHNLHDATGSLPRPFVDTDVGGMPIPPPADPANRLSWRVGLLPYLYDPNGEAVYRRFNLREGWNSPANAPLKDVLVPGYRHPLDAQEPGEPLTRTRCFYDNGAVFESKPHARQALSNIPDGTSNTLLFVESADAVTWTAFNDFRYDPNTPLPKFGHPKISGGFQVALADGSVRFISNKVQERTIRQLITKADGMVISDPDW